MDLQWIAIEYPSEIFYTEDIKSIEEIFVCEYFCLYVYIYMYLYEPVVWDQSYALDMKTKENSLRVLVGKA